MSHAWSGVIKWRAGWVGRLSKTNSAGRRARAARSARACRSTSYRSMEAEAPPRDEAPSRLLERMRMRLLDLSARNPLLNYTHPRGSSLRIVDEVPTLVLDALIANRSYRFT